MCLYAKLIDNPRYKPNKKNGGQVPPVHDQRTLQVPIPCNNCIECRNKKARDWQIRLLEEIKTPHNAKFITLTFTDEAIHQLAEGCEFKGFALDNQIATKAVRLFLERWRKQHKQSLKHFLITELGHNGTNNIHLHGIIWFKTPEDIHKLDQYWQYGYTYKGQPIYNRGKITDYKNYVNAQTIAYIIKYITKQDEKYTNYKPKILTSPGIGKNYTTNSSNIIKNSYRESNTDETYRTTTGHKIALPQYYRNKIYTDEQKENLWIEKLDKQIRYVMGQKIDISKETNTYHNIIQLAKEKNRKLGYGSNRIDYEQKKAEQEERARMQYIRIAKAKAKILKTLLKQQLPEAPF